MPLCRQTGLLQSVVASKSGVSVHSGQRIERVREALSPAIVGPGSTRWVRDMVNALGAVAGAGARPDWAVNAELKFPSLWVVAGHNGLLNFTPMEYYLQLIQAA